MRKSKNPGVLLGGITLVVLCSLALLGTWQIPQLIRNNVEPVDSAATQNAIITEIFATMVAISQDDPALATTMSDIATRIDDFEELSPDQAERIEQTLVAAISTHFAEEQEDSTATNTPVPTHTNTSTPVPTDTTTPTITPTKTTVPTPTPTNTPSPTSTLPPPVANTPRSSSPTDTPLLPTVTDTHSGNTSTNTPAPPPATNTPAPPPATNTPAPPP